MSNGSIDDAVKWRLDTLVDLYKAHLDLYTKGMALFLAIASFTVKAAFDSAQHRHMLASIGIAVTVLVTIPIAFASFYGRSLSSDIQSLPSEIRPKSLNTLALTGIIYTSIIYVLLLLAVFIVLNCYS